ncbi:MAG: chemotaxis protein CheW [Deltaproteobacteria bacterium]|nr:chemotaxis protein CheW [Deltaproteobacteria bacterium]
MIRYGLFCLGPVNYAVPLLQLRKVVHADPGFLLPQLPSAVAGVLVDEGRLVPLLRLAFLSGGSESTVRQAEYKVIVESAGGRIALPAVLVCGVVAENKGALLVSEEKQIPGIIGIFNYQGQEFNVLDIDFLAIEMTRRV